MLNIRSVEMYGYELVCIGIGVVLYLRIFQVMLVILVYGGTWIMQAFICHFFREDFEFLWISVLFWSTFCLKNMTSLDLIGEKDNQKGAFLIKLQGYGIQTVTQVSLKTSMALPWSAKYKQKKNFRILYPKESSVD